MTKNIQERELLNDDAEVCAHLIGHASLLHRHAPCAYRASRLIGYWSGAGQILPLAPGAPGGTGMRAGFHRCRGPLDYDSPDGVSTNSRTGGGGQASC